MYFLEKFFDCGRDGIRAIAQLVKLGNGHSGENVHPVMKRFDTGNIAGAEGLKLGQCRFAVQDSLALPYGRRCGQNGSGLRLLVRG